MLSSTTKQISCRGVKAVHQGGKIQRKSDLRFFLSMQQAEVKNQLLLENQKAYAVLKQSRIGPNCPAPTSARLNPG